MNEFTIIKKWVEFVLLIIFLIVYFGLIVFVE